MNTGSYQTPEQYAYVALGQLAKWLDGTLRQTARVREAAATLDPVTARRGATGGYSAVSTFGVETAFLAFALNCAAEWADTLKALVPELRAFLIPLLAMEKLAKDVRNERAHDNAIRGHRGSPRTVAKFDMGTDPPTMPLSGSMISGATIHVGGIDIAAVESMASALLPVVRREFEARRASVLLTMIPR